MGIAVDRTSGNIYWTDAGAGRIEVCSGDGTSRRALVWKDLKRPSLIALNPEMGQMFWTSRSTTVERAFMNGRGREVFYSSPGIGWQAHFFHFYYLKKKGTYRKNKLNAILTNLFSHQQTRVQCPDWLLTRQRRGFTGQTLIL